METQPPREPKAKIFVIDDSPTGLTMAREILEDAGYLVHTFKSPIGITRALHHLRPDLIVTQRYVRRRPYPSINSLQHHVACPIVSLAWP